MIDENSKELVRIKNQKHKIKKKRINGIMLY